MLLVILGAIIGIIGGLAQTAGGFLLLNPIVGGAGAIATTLSLVCLVGGILQGLVSARLFGVINLILGIICVLLGNVISGIMIALGGLFGILK